MFTKNIDNLPAIKWQKIDSLNEKRKVLLLTSPSAYQCVIGWVKKTPITKIIYIKDEKAESFRKIALEKYDCEVIYAIGGGQVIDIGRLLAFKINKEVVCVPTAISTDAFLVNSTGIRKDGGVKYIPSKKADLVIIDEDILLNTPTELHKSGCADVLSIFTALSDWKLAGDKNNENFDSEITKIADSILESLLKNQAELKEMKSEGIKRLLGGLILEVCLCNIYGNSRPEEGGEHFFCYCLENKLGHNLHGKLVFLGILVTSYLQGQDWQRIKDFLDFIEFNYLPSGITKTIVLETLKEMPSYIKKHNLAFSIYNTLTEKEIKRREQELTQFLNKINIQSL